MSFWLSFLVPFALYLQQLGTKPVIVAWYLLHFDLVTWHFDGICYIWQCLPSILHGICNILALQPLICMVFATFWYFKRSCGFLEGSLGFHVRFHLGFHLGLHLGLYLGFHVEFHLGFHFSLGFQVRVSFRVSFMVSLGFHWGVQLRFHVGFLSVSFRVSLGCHLGCNLEFF